MLDDVPHRDLCRYMFVDRNGKVIDGTYGRISDKLPRFKDLNELLQEFDINSVIQGGSNFSDTFIELDDGLYYKPLMKK